jgi:3-deoxy-D-manno-octulosonic-acid transferase
MGRSLALGLYLLLSRGGDVGATELPAPGEGTGPLVWIQTGPDTPLAGIAHLARQMARERTDLRFLVTFEDAPRTGVEFPPGTVTTKAPADMSRIAARWLDHWNPALIVLTGACRSPALVVAARDRGIAVVLADARRPAEARSRWHPAGAIAAALAPMLSLILAQDPDAAAYYQRLGGAGTRIEITGRIEETTDPLPYTEAERDALATLFAARPVWLAMSCPPSEEEAVIAAHSDVLRLAHRMLLILVPTDPSRAAALAERLAREGWDVALRARDEEPEAETQVFIADGETELGLWYRLAPVTFMGGTLAANGSGRNPMEPAALGSAILHGPEVAPYTEAYSRLGEVRATRQVTDAAGLALALAEVIAPDRAAQLAHNAWAASSGGAEVTDRVARILLGHLSDQGTVSNGPDRMTTTAHTAIGLKRTT